MMARRGCCCFRCFIRRYALSGQRVELHVSSCSSLIFSEDLRTVSKREVIFILMIYLYFDVIGNPFILTWCRSDFTEKIKLFSKTIARLLIKIFHVLYCFRSIIEQMNILVFIICNFYFVVNIAKA